MIARAGLVAICLGVAAPALAGGLDAPPGAMACSGCHGGADGPTVGPTLAGDDEATIERALFAFRSGARPSTMMGRVAKGFSDDEIRAIAAWLAEQD